MNTTLERIADTVAAKADRERERERKRRERLRFEREYREYLDECKRRKASTRAVLRDFVQTMAKPLDKVAML